MSEEKAIPTDELMSLDKAIAHADERAAALSGPCSEQHAQLAMWLRELQEYRNNYQWREQLNENID